VSDQFGDRGELNNVGAVDPDGGAAPETMVTLEVAGHSPQQQPGPASDGGTGTETANPPGARGACVHLVF